MLRGSRLAGALPRRSEVTTADGRRLLVDWSSGMAESIYFLGEYEPAISNIVRAVVRQGDVCLDIGANLGWYTTLLHQLSGPTGEVHAFEPVPDTFRRLEHNLELAGVPANVLLNRVALGDRLGSVEIHLFDGLPDGHASVSAQGHSDVRIVGAKMTTLDSYLDARVHRPVDFVKLDAEGSELPILRGASTLFDQPEPPLMVVEMALATTRHLGYGPNDILQHLDDVAAYEFHEIDERQNKLRPLQQFDPDSVGAYVLCVPRSRRSRLDRLL